MLRCLRKRLWTCEDDVVVFLFIVSTSSSLIAVSPNFSQAEIWLLIKAKRGAITMINGFLGY